MQYHALGHSNIEVSRICLGTMTFGEQNSERQAHAQLDYALDHGVNFIDAAAMYPVPPNADTQGRTEQYLGTWLAATGKRDDVVLAYVNSRSFVTACIIGATTDQQLAANIASSDIELPHELVASIEAIHTDNPNPCP